MRRLLAVGVLLTILIGTAAVTGVPASAQSSDGPKAINTAQDFDRVQFRITVYENHSARWTFHYENTLENESERQQFEGFAREFNGNETQLYTDFKDQARSLTASGQNATGRQMGATNFSKSASIEGLDDNIGTVEMSFTWTNFTMKDGDQQVLGDVFEGGLYLAPNQSLVVEAGGNLTFDDVQPAADEQTEPSLEESDSVTWMDEHEFADNRPRVVFATGTSDGLADIGGATDGEDGESSMLLVAGIVVALLGIGAVVAWRWGDFGLPSSGDASGAAASTGGGAAGGAGGSVQPAVSDEELLTDEARVKQLLRENGGRMKQVNIVEDTGWSKSKVSMLLSEMADDGEISKLRVGRENIISLDGHEPDATRSPHDEPR